MDELKDLHALADAMGVLTRYTDGLARKIAVGPETLIRVCSALGAPVTSPNDAAEALRAFQAAKKTRRLPQVIVAWDGVLPVLDGIPYADLRLENGDTARIEPGAAHPPALPSGYHRLTIETASGVETATIMSAPVQAWRRAGHHKSWGIGTQLAALRSARSRSFGDLRDLESVCHWLGDHGGDLVVALPLHPTFNTAPAEPSPYSPVSRLFWSELMLDLESAHHPTGPHATLDVTRAHTEVCAALSSHERPDPSLLDDELLSYARYRGAQARLGRNWRDWPAEARAGTLTPDVVDANEERFHLVAQTMVRRQLRELKERVEARGVRLGLDLAVGVHPDGYDPWSRQTLFADGMSVGAPPDAGFPSGQDWGFTPVLPEASRQSGHRYLSQSLAPLAELSGVLRIDHIMAWTRLYWIPHGLRLDQGTYVSYPAEELFAVLVLESVKHQCEVVGENLGTVPPEIGQALPRHRIWGMYLAQFQASADEPFAPPKSADVALVGTHDTPTFAGWLEGTDIADRVECGLLAESAVPVVEAERAAAVKRLVKGLGGNISDPRALLGALLEWLGRSESPLVIDWIEDFWLERTNVNVPGTRSTQRPNWQRPMAMLLEDIFSDKDIDALLARLNAARRAHP
ncbi:MAG TPA: 4-alpha-glucanotransferase [Gemmatimonadales bacterium]